MTPSYAAAMPRLLAAPLAAALLAGCGGARAAPPTPDETGVGPVFDGHVDVAIHYARAEWSLAAYDLERSAAGQTSLARMRAGGVGAALLTCGTTGTPGEGPLWPGLVECFAWAERLAAQHADRLVLARTAAEVRGALDADRIAFVLAVEGGDQLDGDLARIPALARAGVRSLGVVYDHHNELGDGAQAFADPPAPPRHGGLSPLGARAIDALNAHGILVDVSHAAESTALAAAARSRAPVIASHSGARALVDTPRNLSDAVIRAIAATDGVVLVPFVPYLVSPAYATWWFDGERTWRRLGREHAGDGAAIERGMAAWEAAHPRPRVTIEDVADHIEHVARVAGRRHVGVGSDFDGMGADRVLGLEDHRGVPALLAALRRRGWTDADLRGLARDNLLRVLAAGPTSAKQ